MKAVCEGFSGERESFQEVRLSNWAEFGSGIFYSRTDHLDNWNLFVYATKQPNLVWTSSAQTMQPFLPLFPGFSQFPSLPSFFLQGLEKLFSRQNLHSRIKNTDKAVDLTIFATCQNIFAGSHFPPLRKRMNHFGTDHGRWQLVSAQKKSIRPIYERSWFWILPKALFSLSIITTVSLTHKTITYLICT